MSRKLIFIVITAFGLFACSEHDLSYYQSHPDKAKGKIKECETALQKALFAEDEDQLIVLSEDPECEAAAQAYTEYELALAMFEQKRRDDEQRKRRELEQAQYAADVEKYRKEFSTMPIADLYAIRNECGLMTLSAKCEVFYEIKKAKAQAYTEHERTLAQIEQKRRDDEQRKRRKLERAQYAADVATYRNEFSAMPMADFYDIRHECSRWGFSKPSAKCKAFEEIKEAKVDVLIKKYEGEKLVNYSGKQCQGIKYMDYDDNVNCQLSYDAVKKQRKDKIAYYLANAEALESVLSDCQTQKSKWKKEGYQLGYKEAFQCGVAKDARRRSRFQ